MWTKRKNRACSLSHERQRYGNMCRISVKGLIEMRMCHVWIAKWIQFSLSIIKQIRFTQIWISIQDKINTKTAHMADKHNTPIPSHYKTLPIHKNSCKLLVSHEKLFFKLRREKVLENRKVGYNQASDCRHKILFL